MESVMTETFKTSPEVAELAGALAKAQSAIVNAREDSKNPHFRASYASLTACWDACREPLTTNGLAVVQGLATEGRHVVCTSRLLHASGQWIESVLRLPAKKDDAQGVGSAATYARRYALCGLVGIAPDGDDDDGNSARPSAPRSRPQPKQAPAHREPKQTARKAPTEQTAKPAPKAAPPTKPEHDPSFTTSERRAFMAQIEQLGWKYAELCRFLESVAKPRPSAMDSDTRRKLLAWLPSEAARPVVAEFLRDDDNRPL